jgi:hypothetical protein
MKVKAVSAIGNSYTRQDDDDDDDDKEGFF